MPDTHRRAEEALILIAEDEPEIAEILAVYLARSGLRTLHAPDGRRALDAHAANRPDLVLLDIQMPVLDGWRVLSELRQRDDTPVILLTAMDQDIDRLLGLRLGADDYVVKPFNPAEVVARVQAILRRTRPDPSGMARRILRAGPFRLDPDSHEASMEAGGRVRPLDLTLTEFRLLAQLMKAPRRVFCRAELLAACQPDNDTLERTIDSHMSKLRKKIEALGLHGVPHGVRGIGYRLWEQE